MLVAFGLGCVAADDPKPACNQQNAGQMWPEAANHDAAARSKLARCGELQICTRTVWRYRWESVTVRLDQLPGGSKFRKPAECEVSAAEPPEKPVVASSTGSN
ncbi:MAG: hypothetical protein LAP38_15905 [Acidobacteriia bacterium]|nr:hypothetical protein [Terriglobia bacterium]